MKSPARIASIVLSVVLVLIISGCGGGSSPSITQPPPHVSGWTWVSGANTSGQIGVYGTQGTASPSNVPGARQLPVSWIDAAGNLWLFGGLAVNSQNAHHGLNDLWKFDGYNWTWVSGANVVSQPGVYGTQGAASPSNVPGARSDSVSWIDRNGNLWLFGGNGIDSAGTPGDLNDLWKFDGNNWTWVSGANVVNQPGVYGTRGTASSSDVPGAREGSASLADASGNLWLFGGGVAGFLNDLWKFDGSNWIWISGASMNNQAGVYGTRGTPSPSNVPGGRRNPASWIDGSGNFWFFGGGGLDSIGATDRLNDLWKFDGSNWTWVSGANTIRQTGTYGTEGTASLSNVPGARISAISWIDSRGNLWLFGGNGIDSAGTQGDLNDLWRYTP